MGNVFVPLGCHKQIPQTEQLQQQKCIVLQRGGWKSKIKMPSGLVSGESLVLAYRQLASSPDLLCPFLCVCVERVLWSCPFLFPEGHQPIGLGLTLGPHVTIVNSSKALSSNTLGLGLQHLNLRENHSVPDSDPGKRGRT